MGLISFLFFQYKTAFNVNTSPVIPNISHCFPLFNVDHLETANCSNLTIVFYPLDNFGQALCIRSCHEDLILTRKSHNCARIAFIQGSKLIEWSFKRIQKSGFVCAGFQQSFLDTLYLTSPQSRCSYSILHLKLFNVFTKNITKRPSKTAKLHQENGHQYSYRHKQKYFQSWVSNYSS